MVSGPFGMGVGATVVLVVVLALLVTALARPTGRRMVSDAVTSVGRWPGLVRAELRGSAPLQPDETGDTTPDIPVVTGGVAAGEGRHRA